MIRWPGNSPQTTDADNHVPTTGIDSMIAEAIRRPVPDSPSSGSEYPVKPARKPSRNSATPIAQFASRGLRNAPVKNTRAMCTTIDAMNSNAAQWCICRMNNPPRTSNDNRSVDSYADDIDTPSNAGYGPL